MPHRVAQSRRVVPSSDRVSFESQDDVEGWLASLALTPSTLPGVTEVQSEGEEYIQWLKTYPHALRQFGEIEQRLKGKRVAVFLDYDGTLTPIVQNPDKAFMSEEMRQTVRDVGELFPTAIISGRAIEKLQRFVQLKKLYYAGSHGLDIHFPKDDGHGDDNSFQPAAKMRPLIDAVYDRLCTNVQHIAGANVEHNAFCLSVHFRNCSEDACDEIKRIVVDLVTEEPSLTYQKGRKVLDVRPGIDWGKGKAVEHFLEMWSYTSDDVVAICLGDDRTDENAFKTLRHGNRGFGIVVSSKSKPSEASYSLRDPSEVLKFLKKLTTWSRSCHYTEKIV